MSYQLSILPVIVKPYEDELFSSWLFRLSAANYTKAHTFCRFHLPGKNIWNRDIDKLVSKEVISRLSLLTEIPYEELYKLTLKSFEASIFTSYNFNGNQKWILPLGLYHRKWKNNGLQYCPSCLSHDLEPYFRKVWRLGLKVVCTKCRLLLLDSCPNCYHPITFFRTEIGYKTSLATRGITTCYHCFFDLKSSPRYPPTIGSTSYQMKIDSIINSGLWKNNIPSKEFFVVLYQILKMIRGNSRMYYQFQNLIYESENQRIKDLPKGFEFEKMSTIERESLLRISVWMLEQWPNRFIYFCKESNLRISDVLRELSFVPEWFNSDALHDLHRPSAIQLNNKRQNSN